MAKVEMKMPEDFLLRLSKLADKTDAIIPKVLEAGGEVVLAHIAAHGEGDWAGVSLTRLMGRRTEGRSSTTSIPATLAEIPTIFPPTKWLGHKWTVNASWLGNRS